MENRSLKGSFTVEAAFVMPIVIFFLLLLIYVGFFFHDRCTIQAVVDGVVADLCRVRESGTQMEELLSKEDWYGKGWFGSLLYSLDSEAKQKISENLYEQCEGKLFFLKIQESEINVAIHTVNVTVTATPVYPLSFIQSVLQVKEVHILSEGKIHDPAKTVRYGKIIFDEFERTKLFSSIEGILSKFDVSQSLTDE